MCDVVHSEKKLTLVFEYSDQDLKKYFDSCNGEIDPDIVKVRNIISIMSSQQQQIVVILYLHYFTLIYYYWEKSEVNVYVKVLDAHQYFRCLI